MTYTMTYRNYTVTEHIKDEDGVYWPTCMVTNLDTGESQPIPVKYHTRNYEKALEVAVREAIHQIKSGAIGF